MPMFDSSPAFAHGLCFWLPVPFRWRVRPGIQRGLSVLAHVISRRAHGSWTTPDPTGTRVIVPASVAFPLQAHGRHPNCVFRSSIPGPSMPLSMLHPAPRGTQRKTRGQGGSLLLSCGALSSPTTRRFIPTIALAYARGSVVLYVFRAAHVSKPACPAGTSTVRKAILSGVLSTERLTAG